MAAAGSEASPTFHDHFSGLAGVYRDFRPRYPAALFDWMAARSPATDAVWDCACGNGQASVGLAEKFDQVYGTDASAQQIEQATPHPRVRYSIAPAEASGLSEHAVDAVLVAQALHWFDFERFYDEVERVVRPGGLFVAVGYESAAIVPEVDAIVQRLMKETLGSYWPKETRLLQDRYRDMPRRFEPIDMPPLFMTTDWALDQLIGYLSSWSGVQRYRETEGQDPLPAVQAELAKIWGEPSISKRVAWRLVQMAGSVD
jgi:SAM-dependent methyltransferase